MVALKEPHPNELVGTWRLISIEDFGPNNKITYPMGKNVTGYLMYDFNGNMAQQIMDKARPKVSLKEATRPQLDEIIAGFDAYSGTYSVNYKEGSITYIVECSIYPSLIGNELKRQFKINDELIIQSSYKNNQDNTQHLRVVKWKKVN